ncbi:WYL domain-containing protein [Oceanobacillus piezotolerans]|uniref:WYL domain-containing protein n=1 Tax=Oceanobacillus piezotolerans TaxID=2448030 RepID=A0A498DRW5_9BACI|nr:WYL domain-containing protein [Oceanobacillus piezotolerans]RLL47727.1 WYL domain-containing protein [Oceanobacillus piezotolerans]
MLITDLSRAIKNQKKIEIIYIASNKQITKRTIRAIKLQEQYLLAYCYSKRSIRLFKLNNILAVQPLKMHVGA